MQVAVLEEVAADTLIIHEKGSMIQKTLPLLFQRLSKVTAATVSMLQHLAACDDQNVSTVAANGPKTNYRGLCCRVYNHFVPTLGNK